MSCNCPSSSPFLWRHPLYQPQISWSVLTETHLSSTRSTASVEAKLREGVDMSTLAYLARVSSPKPKKPKSTKPAKKAP